MRRALLGTPKGNGKTELLAAIALAELAGPKAPLAANIPVTAASFEQAMEILWDEDSAIIFSSVIAFWFGTQSFKK